MPTKVEDAYDTHIFHYTNPRGSDGILRERVIRVTRAGSRFAWFGEGVYMTAVSPSFGRNHLLYNNHHKTHTRDPNLWAKTSIYFKIHSRYLPGVRKVVDRYDRDIYVCPNLIDLNYVPYETGLTDKYQERITFARPQKHCLKKSVASYYAAPDVHLRKDDFPAVIDVTWREVRPVGVMNHCSGAQEASGGSTLRAPQKSVSQPAAAISTHQTPVLPPRKLKPAPGIPRSVPETMIKAPETLISVPGTSVTVMTDAGEKRKKKKKKSCCGQCCIS